MLNNNKIVLNISELDLQLDFSIKQQIYHALYLSILEKKKLR